MTKLKTALIKKMDSELWHKMKMAALAQRKTVGQFVSEAIKEKMKRGEK